MQVGACGKAKDFSAYRKMTDLNSTAQNITIANGESAQNVTQAEATGEETVDARTLLADTFVFSKPDLDATMIGVLGDGRSVDVIGRLADGAWYKIVYSGRIAYVPAIAVQEKRNETVVSQDVTVNGQTPQQGTATGNTTNPTQIGQGTGTTQTGGSTNTTTNGNNTGNGGMSNSNAGGADTGNSNVGGNTNNGSTGGNISTGGDNSGTVTPSEPTMPSQPDAPSEPETPSVPDTPSEPEPPSAPDTPSEPEMTPEAQAITETVF